MNGVAQQYNGKEVNVGIRPEDILDEKAAVGIDKVAKILTKVDFRELMGA